MAKNTEICQANRHENKGHADIWNKESTLRRSNKYRKKRHEEKYGFGKGKEKAKGVKSPIDL